MSAIEERGYASTDALVSTEWVSQHLNDSNLRFAESNEDPLLYASGHIPGAVEVDWTRDLNHPLRRDYLDRSGFEALMRRIGATRETTVVLYGDKSNWWGLLRLLGVPVVRAYQCQDHGWGAPEMAKRGAARW